LTERGAIVSVLLMLFSMLVFPHNSILFHLNATAEVLSEWYPRFNVLMRVVFFGFMPAIFGLWIIAKMKAHKFSSITSFSGAIAGLIAGGLINYLLDFEFLMYGVSTSMLLYYSRHVLNNFFQWLNKEENLIWFRAILILLIAGAAFVRLYLVFITDNAAHADASCRLLISHLAFDYYLPDGNILSALNPNPDWPPLHFYLNSVLLALGFETTGIRFFHAAIGVWSAIVLYRITRKIGSIEVALAVALGYLVYPASAIMSTQVVTAPLFLFTTLQSFSAFQDFYRIQKPRNLNRLIVWLFLGSLLRYEGWLLPGSFIILYAFFIRPIKIKDLLKLCLPFVGPAIISSILSLQGFHGLRGILYSDFQVAYCFDNAGRTLEVFFEGYKEGWIPFSVLGLIAAGFLFRRDRKIVLLISFAVLFATPFVIKNLTFGIFPQYRYLTYYMSILLIPLLMVVWNVISKNIGRTPISLVVLCSFALVVSTSGLWFSTLGIPKFPNGFYQSVEAVKKIPKGQFLLDHHDGVHSYNWIAETNLPLAIEYNDNYLSNQASVNFESINRVCHETNNCQKSIKFLVTDYDSEFDKVNIHVLDSILLNSTNNYLVLFENRPLDRHFSFREKSEEYLGQKFEIIFEVNSYRIYRQNSSISIKP